MTSKTTPTQNYFFFSPNLSTKQKKRLDSVTDRIISKMKKLQENEEPSAYSSRYFADQNKLGNKRFVVRQPESIKQWRKELKALLRKYLGLKFSKQKEVWEHKSCGQPEEEGEKDSPSRVHSSNDSLCLKDEDIGSSEIRFKIKVNSSSSWYRLPTNSNSTLILQAEGLKKAVCLSEKEQLIFQENFLARVFQGSHLEYISHRRRPEKKPDSFWSGWKTQMGAASWLLSFLPQTVQRIIYSVGNVFFPTSPPWVEYQEIIHPSIRRAALEILNNAEEFQLNVVEICGGEGELAVGIAEEYQKPMNYYLLEYNDLSLQRARSLVTSKKRKNLQRIIPIKTDVTNHNDYFVDTAKKKPMQKESVDLVIGSGALTECVLENRERALAVARKCHELLKPKGKMLLAGHTFSLLDSEDFADLSFHVINRSFIGSPLPFSTQVNHRLWTPWAWNKQFYILEKI